MSLQFPITLYDVVINDRTELDYLVDTYLPIDLLADLYADELSSSDLLHLIENDNGEVSCKVSIEPVLDWLADYFDPGPEYIDG